MSANSQETWELPIDRQALYKATFEINDMAVNGFLAVRHEENSVLHVAFTSPVGNNLLEMRWINGRWKKIHVVRTLRNRRMLRILAQDVLLLFAHYRFDDRFVDAGNEWIWKGSVLVPGFADEKLVTMDFLRKDNRKERSVSYHYENGKVSGIMVEHIDFPFSIQLTRLLTE